MFSIVFDGWCAMEARQGLLGIPWGRPRAPHVGLGRPRVVPRGALGSSWHALGVAGDALGGPLGPPGGSKG